MKRFLVGALAFIGAMSVLFVMGLIALIVLASMSRPSVPSQLVLEMDLDRPLPEHVAEASLSSAFGEEPLTVRDVVDALEKAGDDSRVKSLLVRVGTSPGSPATTQEVRDAVKAFRAKGKKAVAFTDSFGEEGNGTSTYYFASVFDEIYMQPSGSLNILGIAFETPFARDALEKLGVKPQFDKRYEYKNAVNSYTEQGYTGPHLEATKQFTGSLFGQMVRGIAEERELTEDAVRALIDRAPLLATEAVESKLLDGLRYRDEVYAEQKKAAGSNAELLYVKKYLERAGRPNTTGDTIALVYAVGTVNRGKSDSSPFGEQSLGSDSVAAALRKAVDDSRVKAILFRVDSPGGSYVASDTVRREVQRAREAGKPVIATMGTFAASGGYFVAMDADKIVAHPGTLTGSIGVYNGKFVTHAFWEKLGVNFDTVSFGRNAMLTSTDATYTPEEQARVDAELDRIYTDFTTRAAASRKMPLEKLQGLAKGRVWTGEDALTNGLVDALGGYPKALALAKEAAKIPADADVRVEEYPRRKSPAEVLSSFLGETGDNSDDASVTALVTPWAPLVEAARIVNELGVRMGVFAPQRGTLYAPVPEARW
ncbi:signal peptide peptidase SppA [Myxococcus landrumensis]|uniref:Signal peptide peptidase SppA n=1 Tax=Myxococcus landrumensis TaxID=2813577 RepID=A0ABX7N3J0_9BACT|nr:signal peptide peptidase SppA [Myxococcus landrumus]QSQ11971.1 signal peptide peptidase SppA [Myxococcus landrumus]